MGMGRSCVMGRQYPRRPAGASRAAPACSNTAHRARDHNVGIVSTRDRIVETGLATGGEAGAAAAPAAASSPPAERRGDIQFAAKDAGLRNDVHELGMLVG